MKIGSLFSGYGGLDMAVETITGATPAWFCEWDEAPSKILNHHWPHVPNLRDVTQVDWSQVEPVDIITGGSPCQDLSAAGKRAGMVEGTRSNLWVNMREAIATIRPRLVVWENVRGALSASATSDSDLEHGPGLLGGGATGHLRALGRVLGDLTDLGYDTRWTTVRASDVGAPHHRARIFLIAWPSNSIFNPGHHAGCPELREQHEKQASWFGESTQVTTNSECDDGGPWSGVNSRGEAGLGAPTSSGSEYGSGTANENTPHTAGTSFGEHSGKPSSEETRAEGSYGSGDLGRKRFDGVGGKDSSDSHSIGSQEGYQRPVGSGAEISVAVRGGEAFPHPTNNGHERAWSPREGGPGSSDCHNRDMEWGEYAPAVRRWERIVGPAPAPTEPNSKGNPRLNAAFAEWMMGITGGHVTSTDIGLSRADQLKAIGNGVCPQQASFALSSLLEDRSHLWPEVM